MTQFLFYLISLWYFHTDYISQYVNLPYRYIRSFNSKPNHNLIKYGRKWVETRITDEVKVTLNGDGGFVMLESVVLIESKLYYPRTYDAVSQVRTPVGWLVIKDLSEYSKLWVSGGDSMATIPPRQAISYFYGTGLLPIWIIFCAMCIKSVRLYKSGKAKY